LGPYESELAASIGDDKFKHSILIRKIKITIKDFFSPWTHNNTSPPFNTTYIF